MAKLFADTYALIEVLKGSPNYEEISHEELVTSEFNIFELIGLLMKLRNRLQIH